MSKSSPKRVRQGLGLLGLVVFLVAVYAVGFLAFVSYLPAVATSASRADGIVALTGGDERVEAAVNLLENKVGKRLLISGVHRAITKEQLKHLAHGGPRFDCCADLGYSAENTRGNAQEAAAWAHTHGYNSLIIVTARYHMPRSLAEFQAAMPDIRLEPYPVEPDHIDLDGWWHDWRAMRVLQGEYAKYLASAVLGALQKPGLDGGSHDGKARAAS